MTTPIQYHHNRHIPKRTILITFTLLTIIVGGAIVWILNIEDIVRGPWSGILGVIFTALSVVLALLQWHSQSTVEAPAHFADQQWAALQPADIKLGTNEARGALLIYTRKNLRGTTVNLTRGFDTLNLRTHIATNIVERKMKNRTVFMGIFPSLEPGNYTVHTNSRQLIAMVTVLPEQVAEIDWR